MTKPENRTVSPATVYCFDTCRQSGHFPGHAGLVYLGPNRTGGATDAHESANGRNGNGQPARPLMQTVQMPDKL